LAIFDSSATAQNSSLIFGVCGATRSHNRG